MNVRKFVEGAGKKKKRDKKAIVRICAWSAYFSAVVFCLALAVIKVINTPPEETPGNNTTGSLTVFDLNSKEGRVYDTMNSEFDVSPVSAVLSADEQAALQSVTGLDNKLIGWGQGPHRNDKNQPTDAVSANVKYKAYDTLFIGNGEKTVYLTFDQGYEHNNNTKKILDILAGKNVKAVFFITGDYAERESELVRAIIDGGHIIGNHTQTHTSMPTVSTTSAAADIKALHQYMQDEYSYEMKLLRPPRGEFSERTLALTQKLGYKTLLWSFAYKDWETDSQPDPEKALEKMTSSLHDGAIYLLHSVSDTNCAVLEAFIERAIEAGYSFSIDF